MLAVDSFCETFCKTRQLGKKTLEVFLTAEGAKNLAVLLSDLDARKVRVRSETFGETPLSCSNVHGKEGKLGYTL